jgi:hypothetical protein
MIMSVSTLIIFSGAATPSSVVNFSMAFPAELKGRILFQNAQGLLSRARVTFGILAMTDGRV